MIRSAGRRVAIGMLAAIRGDVVAPGPDRGPLRVALTTGAAALAGFGVGVMAVGALAVGAVAIGRLAVGNARFRRVEIDDLTVRRLTVLEGPFAQGVQPPR